MSELKTVVVGAGGRMGRALIKAVHDAPALRLSAAVTHAGSDFLGQDAGLLAGVGPQGIPVTDDPLVAFAAADAVLDFTTPSATVLFAEYAAQARIVHIIGTTGFSVEEEEKIKAAARHARIVKSGNMSLGVNLLCALAAQSAKALGKDFDIEILEMHHRYKVDAPSGTALMLGQAAAKGRGVDFEAAAVRTRDGLIGPRPPDGIGFASLRGGSVVGTHTVLFAGESERMELSHIAEDRSVFATGAVKAALWAYPQEPGLYNMQDVLELS